MGVFKYLLKINNQEKNLSHLLGLDDAYASLIHRLSKLGKSSPQSLENGKEINHFHKFVIMTSR